MEENSRRMGGGIGAGGIRGSQWKRLEQGFVGRNTWIT